MIVENTGEQNTPVVNVVNKVVIEHVKGIVQPLKRGVMRGINR